jgi:hypothetical protein
LPTPPRFPIDAIRQDISEVRPWSDATWLHSSWAEPEAFQQALIDYHATLYAPHGKSGPAGIDFYHDAVLRFAMTERVALRWLVQLSDGERVVRSLSYAELHERAAALAQQLRERGHKPGEVLCILLPPADWLLVALLAALRIGATVCLVPPRGQQYVAGRLRAAKPAAILTDRLYSRLCPAGLPAPLVLGAKEEEGLRRGLPDDRSHTYPPAAAAFLVPSPLRDPPAQPVPLSAHAAYVRALHDALIAFALRPGDGLCAPLPEFDAAQYYPALILSTLLSGATLVLCDSTALAKDPSLLPRLGVTCLGLGAELRDRLRKLPPGACAPLSRLLRWFRSALEPLDVAAWRDLDQRCGLAQVPRVQLVFDAAAGGVQLLSAHYKGDPSLLVWPAPGCAWKLSPVDLHGSTQTAPGQVGLFLPAGSKKDQAFIILAKANPSNGDGYFLAGLTSPRRSGQIYPQSEVAAALGSLRGVLGVSGLAVPEAREPLRWSFVVLVFVGAGPVDPGLRAQIEQQLAFALGSEYQPDHVEIYPLFPKRLGPPDKPLSERAIDHAWCRSSYLVGALSQKTQRRSVQILTALREAALRLPNAPDSTDEAGPGSAG